MKSFKTRILSLFLILIFAGTASATGLSSACCNNSTESSTHGTIQSPEIHDPVQPVYLEIEGNSFVAGLNSLHKFLSFVIFENRIVPVNFDFRTTIYVPEPRNYDTPVSIFILGHALLN
jgi:PhoPQ-activated pathogenicity-related protein